MNDKQHLFGLNSPAKFWLCDPAIPEAIWQDAIQETLMLLELPRSELTTENFLEMTLGEARFGPRHWNLGVLKRFYYFIKPIIPYSFNLATRSYFQKNLMIGANARWPVDRRYAAFQWEVLRRILRTIDGQSVTYKSLWPSGHCFAFALTHDIETASGQAFASMVADLEEDLGFHSSFNFVLEDYRIDLNLIDELRRRGFEVGCHGLSHDGKLFNSQAKFLNAAKKINERMRQYQMVGFRSPSTLRHPEWMQVLDIEYDLSFFDTDPWEPIPGGCMSIWPFFMGRFIELPYTLPQDHTLFSILGEVTPRIWMQKVDFIEKYHGMAMLNTHPDDLQNKTTWDFYREFLISMKGRSGYWHELPRELARWWRSRVKEGSDSLGYEATLDLALLDGEELELQAQNGYSTRSSISVQNDVD
jgi:peptidoglycan/xylan/chitin deacetylase (PgdA/CDA1 family)